MKKDILTDGYYHGIDPRVKKLLADQQEAIEKLEQAYDDLRVEFYEQIIDTRTDDKPKRRFNDKFYTRLGMDKTVCPLCGNPVEENVECGVCSLTPEERKAADTHRTVTLRIPKGMRVGKALFEAWDNDSDDVWSDLDEWLQGISDTALQKALDELEASDD